jgi:opacity protein-like surface antigen
LSRSKKEKLLKLKLILVTVLAFAGMAHAQGIMSNISIGAGVEGIFPAGTFTKGITENNFASGGTQATTDSVGGTVDARYDFGRHSAFGVAATYNRNSELFFNNNGEVPNRVKTNDTELIGTYIFRLPSNEKVKPYAMFGGGMVIFSPVTGGFSTGSTPSTDTKPAFAYGFGTDLKVSEHFAIRLQYRGLIRTSPDFKLYSSNVADNTFGTDLRTHVAEPSIQVVYHF